MTYVMTSRDQAANTFTIDVITTIFRDVYQGGATGNEIAPVIDIVEYAVYVRDGNSWRLVQGPFEIIPDNDEETLSLRGNPCFDSSLSEFFEAGKTNYTLPNLTLDVVNNDYLIAYQQCCRRDGILNIIDSGNTGSVTSILITTEAQQIQNSSPVFQNDPEILICNGVEQIIDVSGTDFNNDVLTYRFFRPQSAGGARGDFLTSPCPSREPECIRQCDGLIPDPTVCGPSLFNEVDYNIGFNEFNPIGANVPFMIDPNTGIISGTANRLGTYLIGVIIEESRGGIQIGETRRDFIISVVNCNAQAVIGPPNGDINELERDCTTFPFLVNATQNSCGETNVQVQNYTEQDSMATPFLWSLFEDDGTTLISTNDRNWTPTFPLALGTYRVEFAIFPNETCRAFCTHTIEVTQSVDASFQVIEPAACSTDPINLTPPNLPSSYSLQWDFGNGNTSNDRTPDPFVYDADGDYEIRLTATDGTCMEESVDIVSYVVPPDPVNITVTSNTECVGNPITFNNTIPSDYDVTWSFGDGNMSTELEPIHTYDQANSFTVSVQATAPNGCPADSPEVMIQTEEKPDVTFSINEQAICSGDPIQITGPSASPNATYDWDFGNGTRSTDRDPDPITYAMEDEYIITLTATNPSCSDNSTQTVSYFLPPDAFTVRPSEFLKCSPAEITFENTLPTSSAFSAEWDFDDGNSSTETSPIHTFGNGGIYNVTFNLIAPNGEVCDQRTIPIDIIDGPDADFSFSPNPVLNPNDVVRFTNLTTPITSSFEWEFGDGNDSSQDSPSHIFGLPGDYEVRLIAKSVMNACVDTAFAIVPVSSTGAPEYPNAFRPSTGENLEFKGVSIFSGFTTYRLTIWDRWGQQIFESSDFEEGWNGRKNNSGGILPQGVYVYKADYSVDVAGDLQEFQRSGTVLLIN